MPIKELEPKLQLTLKEYVETWGKLIDVFYKQGISDGEIYKAIETGDEALAKLSMEYATVLLVIAGVIISSRKRMTTKVRVMVRESVVLYVYKEIFGDDEETLNACADYFKAKYSVFSQICENVTSTEEKYRRTDMTGLARYLMSQVSARPEEENAEIIGRVTANLGEAATALRRLAENSAVSYMTITGKPKFVVQK